MTETRRDLLRLKIYSIAMTVASGLLLIAAGASAAAGEDAAAILCGVFGGVFLASVCEGWWTIGLITDIED